MRRRQVLGLLGTAGLSGCLRLTSAQDDDPESTQATATTTNRNTATTATSTATATTQETTEQTETATTTEGPPSPPRGIEGGVNSLLFTDHIRELARTSFRSRWTKLDTVGSNTSIKWQKEYRVEGGRAVGKWTRQGGGPVTVYRTGARSPWREQITDGTTYGLDATGFDLGKLLWSIEIKPLIDGLSWGDPELVSDGDPAVWEVSATGVADNSVSPGYHTDARLLSVSRAQIRVDERGIISSFEATYDIDDRLDDIRKTYSSTFGVENIGNVSVSKPDWVATARDQIPSVSAAVVDGGDFVRLEVTSGNRIAAGSRISVFARGSDEKVVADLTDPLKPGTTAYVAKERRLSEISGYWEGSLSRGSPPSETPPEPFDSSYELTAARQTSEYFPRVDVA